MCHKSTGLCVLSLLLLPGAAVHGQAPASAVVTPGYTIGSGDEIGITIAGADEVKDVFATSFVPDSDGFIAVPMVGRIHASGLTTAQLQTEIRDGLGKYIRDPQVFVNIKSVKSQTVSVLGAVNQPGVHVISGPKTLMETLSLAGGLSKEAGYRIDISRDIKWGVLPVPGAVVDASGLFSTAELNSRRLTEDKSPVENILMKPNDVITVPRADVIYVIGEVKKAGGFTLGDQKQVSVLVALSLAEGTSPTAAQSRAVILRSTPGQPDRVREKINLKQVMQGKVKDVELTANDILYIPDNERKRIATKTVETALSTISGLIIWRGL